MKAVFLTAGAAGMYCGSCMHDNALAIAMRDQDVDCLLQPVYTPIRTDARSMADEQVFFGGIHIYLLQLMPWLRLVPTPIRRTLDWAPLLKFATKKTHSADAVQLGKLTVSMLKGIDGNQADEVARLVDWLADDMQPDAVLLSNLLIGGALPRVRERLPSARLAVLLQGDDIFLDFLPEKQRSEAIRLCRGLVPHVDQFVVHSQFYAAKMGELFQIPDDKLVVTPLSIDIKPFQIDHELHESNASDFRLGYLARIAPEKGLHHLVDAFVELAGQPNNDTVRLDVAGWLGEINQSYLDEQVAKINRSGLADRFTYHGSPDLKDKVRFLKMLDVLCVPTDYHEPKGLFVLESLAAGVPVIQPNHGAFGELVESTGGGVLFEPGNIAELCRCIVQLKEDDELRQQLARTGREQTQRVHSIEQASKRMCEILFP